ncbi:MAG: LPS assembly lipoprotein LptE [Bdellovibrionota bacterium]|nr:MAG: LPS assembly lipoprotein LptE [Bdellovibrionota bacterium]
MTLLLTSWMNVYRSALFSSVLMLVALSGCGYSLQGGGSALPPDIQKIHIPIVENNSSESRLTFSFTEALRDRFERFGVFTIVDTPSEADAVLQAKINRVKRNTGTVTSRTESALQVDTSLYVGAELKRTTGQTLWKDGNLVVTQSFASTGDVVVTSSPEFYGGVIGASDLGQLDDREVARGQEREVLVRLAENAAAKIYNLSVAPDF